MQLYLLIFLQLATVVLLYLLITLLTPKKTKAQRRDRSTYLVIALCAYVCGLFSGILLLTNF